MRRCIDRVGSSEAFAFPFDRFPGPESGDARSLTAARGGADYADHRSDVGLFQSLDRPWLERRVWRFSHSRTHVCASESAEVWDRWERGEGLQLIGRVFGRTSSSIFAHLRPHWRHSAGSAAPVRAAFRLRRSRPPRGDACERPLRTGKLAVYTPLLAGLSTARLTRGGYALARQASIRPFRMA